MGTRGSYGFRLNGIDYLTYNHFDSYPEGLGDDITTALTGYFAAGGTVEQMKEKVLAMRIVQNDQAEFTAEEKETYKGFWEEVSSGKDWYSLLRGMQGQILKHLEVGIMIDGKDFLMDGLFCEWAYIVNLDTEELEAYKGFQDQLHENGRYGGDVPDPEPYGNGHMPTKYYGPALVISYPLTAIPEGYGTLVSKLAYPEENEEEAA